MLNKGRRFLNNQELKWLLAEIGGASVDRQWRALKRLCGLYNSGASIAIKNNSERQSLERLIRGLLKGSKPSSKILHWGMACLSHIGSIDSNEFISKAIQQYNDNSDVVSAGIAALFKIGEQKVKSLVKHNDPVFTALAALQAVSLKKLEDLGFTLPKVNIENAEVDILKNALLLVGMDKAPKNLFEPNYENKILIKKLGGHNEKIIVQYSIWAAAKNRNLTVKDIGVDLNDIDSFPENIREYTYALIAQGRGRLSEHRELIIHCIEDEEVVAIRLALATGLRGNYDDALVKNIDDWYHSERDPEIMAAILEHMAQGSECFERYKEIVVDAYKNTRDNGQLRQQLEGAAEGLPFYRELRFIALNEESAGLFGNGGSIVNINGRNINIGAVAQGGDADNSGSVHQINQIPLNNFLEQLQALIKEQSSLLGEGQKQILTAISEAKEKPNRGILEKLRDKLRETVSLYKDTEFATQLLSLYIPALTHFVSQAAL